MSGVHNILSTLCIQTNNPGSNRTPRLVRGQRTENRSQKFVSVKLTY